MATDPHAIQLTSEQLQMLGQFSARTGKPPEDVLADALRQYEPRIQAAATSNGSSLYDKLARKGLIGCLKGGPPDLSTNPEYMEGFGDSDR
jgi:hypothetical protein